MLNKCSNYRILNKSTKKSLGFTYFEALSMGLKRESSVRSWWCLEFSDLRYGSFFFPPFLITGVTGFMYFVMHSYWRLLTNYGCHVMDVVAASVKSCVQPPPLSGQIIAALMHCPHQRNCQRRTNKQIAAAHFCRRLTGMKDKKKLGLEQQAVCVQDRGGGHIDGLLLKQAA